MFQNVCFCIWKLIFPGAPPSGLANARHRDSIELRPRQWSCQTCLQGKVLRNYNFPCIYIYIYITSLFMQASSLSPTQLFFVLLSLLVSTKSLSNLCRSSVTSCSKTVSFRVFASKASLYLKLCFAKTLFPSAAGCLAGSSYRCLQRACLQSFVSPPCATCCTHAHV